MFNDFLILNRKERIILIFLLIVSVLLIIANTLLFDNKEVQTTSLDLDEVIKRKYYHSRKYTPKTKTFYAKHTSKPSKTYERKVKTKIPADYEKKEKKPKLPKQKYSLSAFDPNSVQLESLLAMQLPEFWCERLVKFRQTGAVFREKSDVKKIYGTTEQLYQAILPYVTINEAKIPQKPIEEIKTIVEEEEKEIPTIEINSANEEELDKLRGIGPSYAKRIIKYRDLLGGYHNIDQLEEVYGLKEETLILLRKQVTIEPSLIMININTSSVSQLVKHPYISKKKAKIISNYMRNNGRFEQVEDIEKTKIFSKEELTLLLPYLTI